MPYWPDDVTAGMAYEWGEGAIEEVHQEYAIYQAGWVTQLPHRVMMALYLQTFMLAFHSFWSLTGLMFVGMALYKCGWLTGRAAGWTYGLAIGLAVGKGLPIIGAGVLYNLGRDWDLTWSFVGMQFNYWGSLLVAGGWIAITVLVVRYQWLPPVRRGLSAVGQTALSNYLFQSLVCTFIFYGHGLGLFGDVSRVGQLAVVGLVWLIQIALSLWWVKRYRFGPMEWLWRSLTYGKRQALTQSRLG
ncbi:DUF418 domain-containing protein [Phycisphaerales bacterium AB-hyl4]|uniref:DUF418 domain-containing protein n=1 Tax=Natronomicrosphaera hydrolytica TaxID=3242702 RepID=A0ABV4UBD6_9BACT